MLSGGFNENRWHVNRVLVPSSKGLWKLISRVLSCQQAEVTLRPVRGKRNAVLVIVPGI